MTWFELTRPAALAGALTAALAFGAHAPRVAAEELGGVANDTCEGALAVPACGNPSPGPFHPAFPYIADPVNIGGATKDGDPAPSCKGKKRAAGIWYTFMPEASGRYRITTCTNEVHGTTIEDTVLALFRGGTGSCPQGAQIACGDDDKTCKGHEEQASIEVELEAFKNYDIVAYATEDTPVGSIQIAVDRVKKGAITNGDFEQGTLQESWDSLGDVAVLASNPPQPCIAGDSPVWGCYMACLSNGSFFGGEAIAGLRSDLTSREVVFDSKPLAIEVTFAVDFQTEDSPASLGQNDAFQARLVTRAGTFPIIELDSFGRTPPGSELHVTGFDGLIASPDGCTLSGGRGTGRIQVTWKRTLNGSLQNAIGRGPVHVEFSVVGQGGTTGTTLACVDDVVVRGLTSQ